MDADFYSLYRWAALSLSLSGNDFLRKDRPMKRLKKEVLCFSEGSVLSTVKIQNRMPNITAKTMVKINHQAMGLFSKN